MFASGYHDVTFTPFNCVFQTYLLSNLLNFKKHRNLKGQRLRRHLLLRRFNIRFLNSKIKDSTLINNPNIVKKRGSRASCKQKQTECDYSKVTLDLQNVNMDRGSRSTRKLNTNQHINKSPNYRNVTKRRSLKSAARRELKKTPKNITRVQSPNQPTITFDNRYKCCFCPKSYSCNGKWLRKHMFACLHNP